VGCPIVEAYTLVGDLVIFSTPSEEWADDQPDDNFAVGVLIYASASRYAPGDCGKYVPTVLPSPDVLWASLQQFGIDTKPMVIRLEGIG
jgi:hypothetical protein